MRARDFWKVIAALVVWACSVMPVGAQGVGTIGGTVTDTSDAVMPGVAITLSSTQGTIGANQQTVTDERGAYQFLRLVPGTYIVKAELQGFRPAEQTNIVVNADETSRANLKLQIGTLAEGVTVTGEAPLLDTTSALKQTVLSSEVLKTLPNRFDVWSAARVSPSIVMSQVDVGGSAAFLQSGPTLHGSNTENGYSIDGMDISNIEGNGSGTAFFLEATSYQEMNLQMGGAGTASADRGGLVFNMITRTGTNSFHGGGHYAGASSSLNADNLSTALRTQLLASVPAVVLAANPNFQPSSHIKDVFDSGGWLAGPVFRDKLWFSVSANEDALNQYILGSYNPSGSQVLEDNLKFTFSEKAAWQMTRSTQLTYFNNLQYRRVGHRPILGTYADSNSRAFNSKYPDIHQVKFTSPWRSHVVLDASFNQYRYDDNWSPEPGVVPGTVSHYETTTDAYIGAQPTYPDWKDRRDSAYASISFFSGQHDVRAGYQFMVVNQKGSNISTSGMRANFTNGIPSSVNTYDVPILGGFTGPIQYDVWDRTNSFYVQDKWTPTKKLVVNAGLRVGTDFGWEQPSCSATNTFVAAQCFSRINGVPNFKTVSPRVSAVYDLIGDGRTALKFAANRYIQPVSLNNILRVNPAVVASDSRSWTACAPGQTSGCDLNGDGLPQPNELGPSNGYSFGVVNRWAPGLKAAYSDEYSVELQRQLPGNIVVSGGYTYRRQRNQFGFRNILVPPDSYTPLAVTEVASGQAVTVYNQSPATKGQFDDVWSNDPGENIDYHGGDISVNKRMSNGWSLMGGASYGKTIGDVIGGDLNNPNSAAYRTGAFGNDVPWSYRMSGVFDLPFHIASSATTSYYAGFPELTTVTVNSRTVALTQSTQSVVVSTRGTTRFPSVFQLDASLRRPIRLQNTTVEPRIDFYNLSNGYAVQKRVTTLGPAYGRPSDVQRGRLIKFGMSVEF
jgi:Carboxypeptidase regulatory-like domain